MPGPPLDRPIAVRTGEDLDTAALGRYLQENLGRASADGPAEVEVEQFPSGFSNLTYLVHFGDRQMVLRRPPFGAGAIAKAHDMGREHRILTGLAGVYGKVPRPLLYCEDEAVIGAPFYLMERVEGVILRSRMATGERPSAGEMSRIAEALIETLAELHAVDPAAAGLERLGRPEGYVERQIEGWTKRYFAARTDDVAPVERAARWLARRIEEGAPVPGRTPSRRPALIHNDYKYDNVVLDPADRSRILAVLDWEMATVGEPLMDLGTTLGYWIDPDDPPLMKRLDLSPTTLAGNPGRVGVVERYARATGLEIADPVFLYVYGLFKIAVIVQQIYYRYRQGTTEDPRFAALIESVRACGEAACQAMDKGRIDRLF